MLFAPFLPKSEARQALRRQELTSYSLRRDGGWRRPSSRRRAVASARCGSGIPPLAARFCPPESAGPGDQAPSVAGAGVIVEDHSWLPGSRCGQSTHTAGARSRNQWDPVSHQPIVMNNTRSAYPLHSRSLIRRPSFGAQAGAIQGTKRGVGARYGYPYTVSLLLRGAYPAEAVEVAGCSAMPAHADMLDPW